MSGIGGGGSKMSGPITVSVPTILWGPYNVQDVESYLFSVANIGAHDAKMLIESSPDGKHFEDKDTSGDGATRELPVPAGGANSFSIQPSHKRRYYQLSAYTPDPHDTETSVLYDVVTLSRG